MIALDDNGDFVTDSNGRLVQTQNAPLQDFKSETRCIQDTYPPDLTFGRNTLIWQLGNIKNRIDDITRIGQKYIVVQSVTFDKLTKVFRIT